MRMTSQTLESCFSVMLYPGAAYRPITDKLASDLAGTGIEVRKPENSDPDRRPSLALLPPSRFWLPEDFTDRQRAKLQSELERSRAALFQPYPIRFDTVGRTVIKRTGATFFNLNPDKASLISLRSHRNGIFRSIQLVTGNWPPTGEPPLDVTSLYAPPEVGRKAHTEISAYLASFLPLEVVFDPAVVSFPTAGPQGE